MGDDALALCDHDFEEAIRVHVASKSGWDGFLLQFHCNEPWKDHEWEIDDIDELVQILLRGMANNLPEYFCSSNCLELINFLKRSLLNNDNVTIKYDWGGV